MCDNECFCLDISIRHIREVQARVNAERVEGVIGARAWRDATIELGGNSGEFEMDGTQQMFVNNNSSDLDYIDGASSEGYVESDMVGAQEEDVETEDEGEAVETEAEDEAMGKEDEAMETEDEALADRRLPFHTGSPRSAFAHEPAHITSRHMANKHILTLAHLW